MHGDNSFFKKNEGTFIQMIISCVTYTVHGRSIDQSRVTKSGSLVSNAVLLKSINYNLLVSLFFSISQYNCLVTCTLWACSFLAGLWYFLIIDLIFQDNILQIVFQGNVFSGFSPPIKMLDTQWNQDTCTTVKVAYQNKNRIRDS